MANWNIESDFDEEIILNGIGDPEKRKILKAVLDTPKTIMEIKKECNISFSSCYRKINQMVKDGLLVEKGFVFGSDSKKSKKYRTTVDEVTIIIKKRKKT